MNSVNKELNCVAFGVLEADCASEVNNIMSVLGRIASVINEKYVGRYCAYVCVLEVDCAYDVNISVLRRITSVNNLCGLR